MLNIVRILGILHSASRVVDRRYGGGGDGGGSSGSGSGSSSSTGVSTTEVITHARTKDRASRALCFRDNDFKCVNNTRIQVSCSPLKMKINLHYIYKSVPTSQRTQCDSIARRIG